MANRKQNNPKFSKKRLKAALDYQGYTLDTLCKYKNIGISARQAWRYWKAEEMPADILDNMARALNVSVNYLQGFLEFLTEDQSRSEVERQEWAKVLVPEKNPYIEKDDFGDQIFPFFESLFKFYGISNNDLEPYSSKWLRIASDINKAIVDTLSEYFIIPEQYYLSYDESEYKEFEKAMTEFLQMLTSKNNI